MNRLAVLGILVVSGGCSVFVGDDGGGGSQTGGCDSETCEAAGGICNSSSECEFTCEGAVDCTCPEGSDCLFNIADNDVAVGCSAANDCRVRCNTAEGCTGTSVSCGAGDCEVTCIGMRSCESLDMRCGAGPCSLDCSGNGACQLNSSLLCGRTESCTLDCKNDACGGLQAKCEDAAVCSLSCIGEGNNICKFASLTCDDSPDCTLVCNSNIEQTGTCE